MRTTDLPSWLAALQVRPDAYDISGGSSDEAYILRVDASRWEVFYSERGQQNGYVAFSDESAACAHFCTLIENDPTTRAG